MTARKIVLLLAMTCAYRPLLGLADDSAVPEPNASPDVRAAIERALGFLKTDAEKWKQERQCSTCHHGTFTVWTMAEARRAGFDVPPQFLAESLAWTKERLDRIDLPRDTRPGWSMVNTIAIYLALMQRLAPDQQVLNEQELRRIEGHLVRHQEEDGSWAWSSAPAKNRPPPFFESDEVATQLVLTVFASSDRENSPELRNSLGKARQWMANTSPTGTTQAAALRVLQLSQREPADALLPREINNFVTLQRPDGGWGQLHDRPSDAYATGQALFVLSVAGVSPQRAEIRRGVNYLISTQKADGSWPMVRRGHEGVTPGDFVVPINYFGAAWATLGLLRTVN